MVEELQILDEEAAACQRIAEDLVAYSRMPDLECEPVAVENFLKEAVKRFRETPEGSTRSVKVVAEDASVYADRSRIRQVILNLLINAGQVSDTKSPIEVTGRQQSKHSYMILISDRGPGVDENDKPRIFEPFYSKRRGGTGLGLAVCQGIIRAHGGSIHVEDRQGGGAVFRVVLPRYCPSEVRA